MNYLWYKAYIYSHVVVAVLLLAGVLFLVSCASASRNTTYASDIPEYIDRNPVD